MFYSKNPVFSEKSIVKAEVLQENVLYPMRMFEHLYADYTDGIVTGVRLQAKDIDELLLSPGIIKYQGRLYHMEESACVEFEHNNRMNYLKIRFDNGERTSDGELFHTQVLLTNEETCFPYEMELGRFFTEAGARLIDHAQHFEDFFIEHNHIDVRHVPYSARTEATISPEITVAFARDMLQKQEKGEADICFCMQCLRKEPVDREIICAYISAKTGRPAAKMNNAQMCEALLSILKKGRTMVAERQTFRERRSIIVD